MEFILKVESINGFPIDFPEEMIGITDIDKARTDLFDSQITQKSFPASWGRDFGNLRLALTEEQARKANLFLIRNVVVVNAKRGEMNKYCSFRYWRSSCNGIVEKKTIVNKEKILSVWEKMKYSLAWKEPEPKSEGFDGSRFDGSESEANEARLRLERDELEKLVFRDWEKMKYSLAWDEVKKLVSSPRFVSRHCLAACPPPIFFPIFPIFPTS